MLASAVAALVLVGVHLVAAKIRFRREVPRSRVLSIAGGAAVAFVFLQLLPELAAAQQVLREATPSWLRGHVYVLALAGLSLFYGLEILARRRRGRPGPHLFWVHVVAFSLYSGLIGYIVATGDQPLVVFTMAMGLHFLAMDHALEAHHPGLYARAGRWWVSGAIVVGWGLGVLLPPVPEPVLAALLALLAGAIVLNVLKEELPEERSSSYGAFLVGVLLLGALLLLVRIKTV